MDDAAPPMTGEDPAFLAGRGRELIVLMLLLALAAGLRLPGLFGPPLELKPSRQYRTAILARALYWQDAAKAPDAARRSAALAAADLEGRLEPPLLENVACWLYRLGGGERLWLPRLLNVLAWLTVGLSAWWLARREGGAGAGLAAAAVAWFVPFTIPMSRSLQPDVVMVALMMGALVAMVAHELRPRRSRWILALLLGGAATLVKPMAIAFLAPAWIALVLARRREPGISRSWFSALLLPGLMIVPALAWIGLQLAEGGRMGAQMSSSFSAGLYARPYFWRGWLRLIGEVAGYALLTGGVAGLLLLRPGRQRWLLLGLVLGYGAFGLAFNYHIHTHDYYHLPLIPILALAAAPAAGLVLEALRRRGGERAALVVLLVAVGLAAAVTLTAPRRDPAPMLERARIVGESVSHSSRTLILAPWFGKALQYHAGIAGAWWPTRSWLREEAKKGEESQPAAARLEELRKRNDAEWFVVTDLAEWRQQPELRAALEAGFPQVGKDPRVRIFDLR